MPFEKPQNKEGKFLRLPKVGETVDYADNGSIKEIRKVEGSRFTFNKKVTFEGPNGEQLTGVENLGYCYEIVFDNDKILTVSSWKPYYAMINANITEGCFLRVLHPLKGEWKVEKK